MSQSSYNLANQSGASYRVAVNNAFQAIASRNYGVAAPTETYPLMYWADTSGSPTVIIKQRNSSNSAWVNVAVMDGSGVRPYYNGSVVTSVVSRTVGVAANNVLALDANAKIPAVDGSQIIGVGSRASAPPEVQNSLGDPDHDMDIAAGRAVLDLGTVATIPALTKRIDAAWSVGTNQGGLDTGTVQADTWYSMWAISRSDTGVVDVMYSTDQTTPTNLPANYDDYRRIRWVQTDGSANIIPSNQSTNSDKFYLATPVVDYSSTISSTAVLITLSVPPLCNPIAFARFAKTGGTPRNVVYTSPHLQNDVSAASLGAIRSTDEYITVSLGDFEVNSSSQIRARGSGPDVGLEFDTYGWVDRRGRDD